MNEEYMCNAFALFMTVIIIIHNDNGLGVGDG